MADIFRPQPIEVYTMWLAAIYNEATERLSNWETNFCSSIDDQLHKQGRNLTEAQANKLEQIYTKYT